MVKRLFGAGADPATPDPSLPTTEPADGEVQLTPARRSRVGASEPREMISQPTERTPTVATTPNAQLDILLSVTRSFRDTVADRLHDFADVLDQMSGQMVEQRTATASSLRELDAMVKALNTGFAALQADLLGLSQRLTTVLSELAEYDLRAASTQLGEGIGELRQEMNRGDAQIDEMRRHVESQVASLLDRLRADVDASVATTNERVDAMTAEIRRLDNDVNLMRRRMVLTGRDTVKPVPGSEQRR